MSKIVNSKLPNAERPVKSNWKSIRHELLKQTIGNHGLPFDFTGKEPANDPMWPIVRFYIAKGYLTEDLQPTTHALEMDYIRNNDGSRIFEQLDQQPALLFTSQFLLYIEENYDNELANLLNESTNDGSNR